MGNSKNTTTCIATTSQRDKEKAITELVQDGYSFYIQIYIANIIYNTLLETYRLKSIPSIN